MRSVFCRLTSRRNITRWLRRASSLPEHTVLEMPALSPTMAQGNISKWLIKEGDEFSPGDAICDIETDKATVSYDVQDSGFLAKIIAQNGAQNITVGEPIAVTVEEAEDVGAFKNYAPGGASSPVDEPTPAPSQVPSTSDSPAGYKPTIEFRHGAGAAAPSVETATASTPARAAAPSVEPASASTRTGSRVFASPYARTLAKEKGVDLSTLSGTGYSGRVIGKDVLAQPTTPAPAAPPRIVTPTPIARGTFIDTPLTQMRKTIAQRLFESKSTIPHYQVTMECELNLLNDARKALNEAQTDVKLSVNDFIIKAVAMSLRSMPACNSAFMGNFIREFGNVDISVAVATPSGLITPIITDADLKGLKTISLEMKDLAKRAKEGKLALNEFQGGSFTISNLGMFGVNDFNAIINPPQACILAVGGAVKQLKPCDRDARGFRESTVMYATLSSDHRVVDGALAAQFLKVFKTNVENPAAMLL